MFNFEIQKLKTTEELGKGRFGTVFPYKESPTDDKWVVKYIVASTFKEFQKVMQEIALSFNHSHPSILPFNGFHIQEDKPTGWKIYIKMPRMQKNLRQLIEEQKAKQSYFWKEQIIRYFYTIVKGLSYLESLHIAHRDIKPENILLDKDQNLKIADIGIGKLEIPDNYQTMTYVVGSPYYMAPEIFDEDQNYDPFKADAWSLGVVIAELCLLTPKILSEQASGDQRVSIVRENLNNVEKIYGKELADILRNLLNIDPSQRKSFVEIIGLLNRTYSFLEEAKEVRFEEVKNVSSEKNEFVLKDMQERWNSKFNFDYNGVLTIRPHDPSELTDQTLSMMMRDLCKKIKEYKSDLLGLSLDLSWCEQLKPAAIKELENIFEENFRNLRYLSMEFSGCEELTDETLEHIGLLCAQRLPNIQKLALNFYRCSRVTNKGVKRLFSGLAQRSESLQKLSLNLSCCGEITNEALDFLSSSVSKNFQKLQALSLNFGMSNKVGNQGIGQLTERIAQNLKDLKQLSLNFAGCKEITNEALQQVASNVGQYMKDLEQLSLDFRTCNKITNDGVNKLTTSIGEYLKNLVKLHLDFSWCDQITDACFAQLNTIFAAKFKGLQDLSLGFAGCNNVTLQGIEKFKRTLNEQHRTLSHLLVDFSGCDQVEENKQIITKERV